MKVLSLLNSIALLLLFALLAPSSNYPQAVKTPPRVLLPIDDSTRIVLKGSTHPLAQKEFDTGAAPDDLPMANIVLLLQRSPEQEAALQQLLVSQQTKSSANFHRWLTPTEFGLQFGPADGDVKALTDWLVSHGFSVQPVSAGRTVLEISGTAAQVRTAFRTEIHKYVVGGQEYWANNKDIEIPRALGPVLQGVLSLNNFSPTGANTGNQAGPRVQSKSPSKGSGTPDVTLANCTGSGGSCYGVGPGDFATIYDVGPLYAAGIDGTGQTIAIASSTNIYLHDTQNFRQIFNLPANDPNVIVMGPDPGVIPADENFADLQVEWAGAIAPNATIDLVVTQSTSATEGANLSAISVVEGNLAPILTLNYMHCEASATATGAQFYSTLWEQAVAEGITVVVPAGDTGAAACDSHFTEIAASQPIGVNAVASTPYNVAVGGTDFNQVGNWSQYWNTTNNATTLASAIGYIPEETYNDTCAENGPNGCSNPNPTGSDLIAGGGGVSIYNPIPVWQSTTGFPMTGGRVVPDLSLFAGDGNNGSFYLLCQGDANSNGDPSCNLNPPYNNIQAAGGTSASAAVFAAIMALVEQYNNGPQGNANFVLYPLAANASSGVFHDITVGNTSVACVGGSTLFCSNSGSGYGILENSDGPIWSAAPGYDLATGWGSVDVNNLVTKWSTINFQPTTTTIVSVSPPTAAHGAPVTFNITVTSAAGTPTGDVALIVSSGGTSYAADAFTLINGSINASTTKLPGGTYNIAARYAGDSTFAPSTSAPFSITINQQASQVSLAMLDYGPPGTPPSSQLMCESSGATEAYATVYYLNVVVGNVGDTPGGSAGCYPLVNGKNFPTGTVTVTDLNAVTGVTLNTVTSTLNAQGYVEIPSFPSSITTHEITVTYSGDSSYGASSAGFTSLGEPFFLVQIIKTTSTVSLSASSTVIAAGQNVTLTATVRNPSEAVNGALPPSGVVTFATPNGSSPGTVIGTASLLPSSTQPANLSSIAQFTFAPTQQISVTAYYAGDTNYSGNNSGSPITITIGQADFTLAASPNSLNLTAGQPGSTTITVTPSLGYTGTVALACPASTSLPLGMTCSISPSSVTLAANGTPQTATLTLNTQGPSIISASARPSGREWITALAGSLSFGLVFILGRRRRRDYAFLFVVALVALYCGSCGTATSVQKTSSESSISLTTSAVKSPQGSPVTITAVISADHTVTGTVNFFDNGAPIAQGVPVNAGRAAITTSTLALGTHPITAAYSGDSQTNPATTSTPLEQVITGNGQLQISATSGTLTHNIQIAFTLN